MGVAPSEGDSMGMSCEDAWKAISDNIDENLDVAHRRALDRHLARCRHCTAVLHGVRNLLRLYRDERVFTVPDGFHERLERRLRQITVSGPRPRH
jgi:anti-sigma factor RsiW